MSGSLKLSSRNLRVVLSIGGWTYSQSGHFNFVTDAAKRTTFINSAVQLIEDYGFDGIDIDYEFPSTPAQGQGFADLMTGLRTAFTALAAKKGDTVPYQLSVRRCSLLFCRRGRLMRCDACAGRSVRGRDELPVPERQADGCRARLLERHGL